MRTHVRAPSQYFTRAAVLQAFHTWLPSAARTRLRTIVTENARHIDYMSYDEQNKGGRVATHTTKDKSTDVFGDKREEDTAVAAVVVVAHYSTAERRPSRRICSGAAASTSCPCPTAGLRGD